MKPVNSLCGKNTELQNVNADCTYGSHLEEQFGRIDMNKQHMAVHFVTIAMFSFASNDEGSYTRIVLHIFQSEFYEKLNHFIALGFSLSFTVC
jgi:hypothetical protein